MPKLIKPLTAALAATVLSGCATFFAQAPAPQDGPVAPPAAEQPPARPQAPLEADWTFGAVEATRAVDSEPQIIYRLDDDPSDEPYGLAGSYYVTVKGQDYMIHWDQAEKFGTLEAGQTVNLHPSDYASCVKIAGGAPTCRRLYRFYKNSRPIAPIGTR